MMADGHPRVWGLFKHYYPSFAGAAIQGHRVLSHLAEQGFSIQILAAADHAAKESAGQAIKLDGLTIHYLPVVQRRDWRFLSRVPSLRKLASSCSSLVSGLFLSLSSAWVLSRNGRPGDVVQLYSCNSFSFLVVWLARLRGMHPVIRMTLVGSGDDPGSFQKGPKRILGLLTLEAFRRAEALVSISSALAECCRSAGLYKVERIPNGVDLNLFHPLGETEQATLRTLLGLGTDRRYIAFVGMALHRKGIDVLINAFIQVARQISDVDLLIIGPSDPGDCARHEPKGPQVVADLKQELAQAGYSSRVHWTGNVNNVHEFLQAADVFCLPTRREGLPNSVIEAMATGLPMVVANLEGVTTDLIHSGRDGILVAGHEPGDYADALLRLLQDKAKAEVMGNQARARAEAEFGIELAVQRYAELYRELADVAV